ncbi:MAG: hypothetical protein WCX70_02955 [Candidatus Paceibacterota bacterium]|jgi:hypothetical protein
MSIKFRGESSDFVGQELEEAYANAFGGKIIGGFNDHGKDVFVPNKEVESVQIKSSTHEMKKFLSESLRRRDFIPICVGLPGTKEEMLDSIKKFGAWVGNEIPNREKLLAGVVKLKELCYNENRLINELGEMGFLEN